MQRSAIVLTLGILFLTSFAANADDYIKDGKLTHRLRIVQQQGGFAGFTGVEFIVEPDGAWTTSMIFNQKKTPRDRGKLTAKELESLAAILAKHELDKLPPRSGKQPGANPHIINIEFGKTTASLVGQTPPKVDANNPTASVESRFAGIYRGVTGMLKGIGNKKAD